MKYYLALAVVFLVAACGVDYQNVEQGVSSDPCETISCSDFGDCNVMGGSITCDCPDDSDCAKDAPCYLALDCRCDEDYITVSVACAVDRLGQPAEIDSGD